MWGWGGIYNTPETIYRRLGDKIVVDSASSSGNFEYFVTSAQDESGAIAAQDILLMRRATAVWQSVEWRMRAFQGSFPRVRDRFVYEERGEKVVLWTGVLPFSLRKRIVGLNLIVSTHMSHPSAEDDRFLQQTLSI